MYTLWKERVVYIQKWVGDRGDNPQFESYGQPVMKDGKEVADYKVLYVCGCWGRVSMRINRALAMKVEGREGIIIIIIIN